MSVNTARELPDGIHKGISNDDYHAVSERVNASLLKVVAEETPLHARSQQLSPSASTPAQEFGTAAHLNVLEPVGFEKQVVKGLGIDRRSNANKALWLDFEERNAGKLILTEKGYAKALAVGDQVRRHRLASQILDAPGINEVTLFFTDPTTGLPCKVRPDRLCVYNGRSCIVDLKTIESASDSAIKRALAQYKYPLAAAFYLFGAETLEPLDRTFYWLFVEKKGPGVRVVEIDPQDLYEGGLQYRRALDKWAKCVENETFPGWERIQTIQQARWAQMSDAELDEEIE